MTAKLRFSVNRLDRISAMKAIIVSVLQFTSIIFNGNVIYLSQDVSNETEGTNRSGQIS
jgi:hypothetical protein